jgi:hypothetical protein
VTKASLYVLQTLGGLVVQRKENQALLIWDHGVLMREKVHDCFVTGFSELISGCWIVLQVDAPTACGRHETQYNVVCLDCRSSTGTAWRAGHCHSLCASS